MSIQYDSGMENALFLRHLKCTFSCFSHHYHLRSIPQQVLIIFLLEFFSGKLTSSTIMSFLLLCCWAINFPARLALPVSQCFFLCFLRSLKSRKSAVIIPRLYPYLSLGERPTSNKGIHFICGSDTFCSNTGRSWRSVSWLCRTASQGLNIF